jgi:hypothetical protein
MTIERTSHLHEILIRFGPDGYRGAHVIDLERVVDGGELISERELPARPVTQAEIGPIIGAENARLIEAADQAIAAAVQAVAAGKAAIARAEAAEADAAAHADDLAELRLSLPKPAAE